MNPAPSHIPASRFQFIDLLRGWAVFIMIETHVVNALLSPEIKSESFFKVLTFINGLVAPSFLFCAGQALAVTLRRKWRDYTRLEPVFWRYSWRLVFLLVVGYSLHLPFFSLARLMALKEETLWIPFFQVDILQTIAVTLLCLLFLALVSRREDIFTIASAIIAAAVVFSSPVVRELDFSQASQWLRAYLTPQYKSQFPLFPWSAFLIAGTITGHWFIRAKERGRDAAFMKYFSLLALASACLSVVIESIPVSIYPNHDFWKASPGFFFLRLGLVALALGGLWFYESRRVPARKFPLLRIFGQESLLVYVLHLLIVYGYTYKFSFVRYFGPHLNYAQCAGLYLALALAMYVVAYVWHWLKGWNAPIAKTLELAVIAGIVITFIFKPD